MKRLILIFLFLISFFNLNASEEFADDIGQLSAYSLYYNEYDRLKTSLEIYLKTNKQIAGVNVIDSYDADSVFLSASFIDGKYIFGKEKFDNREDLESFTGGIYHEGIDIGIVKIYLKKHDDIVQKISYLTLTSQEKEWIKNNSIVTVGTLEKYPPYSYYSDDGKPQGVAVDFINTLADIAGLNIVFDEERSWKKLYKKAQDQNLNILTSVTPKVEREKWFLFTKPYIEIEKYIISKKDDNSITSVSDLQGKTVAVNLGFTSSQDLLKEFPSIKPFSVNNSEEAIKAVSAGLADAAISSLGIADHIMKKHLINNLKFATSYRGESVFEAFAVSKNSPELQSILNKALDALTEQQKLEILSRSITPKLLEKDTKTEKMDIGLTTSEKEFLNNNPRIRVHNEKNWAPFNFYEFGQPQGYSIDLMKLVAKNTGFEVDFISGPTWDQFLEMMKKDELDVVINIVKNSEREKYMLFTDPFMQATMGIAIHKDTKDIKKFDDILTKKVSLENGFYFHDYFKNNHPNTKLHIVDDGVQTLQSVEYKEADATIGFVPVMKYLAGANFINDLDFIADTTSEIMQPLPLRFSTSINKPELQSILQKGLASITPSQKRQLSDKWLGTKALELEQKAELSENEKKWIEENIVKVGVEQWAPVIFSNTGSDIDGIAGDILRLVIQRTGLETEIINDLWDPLLNDFKEDKIDLLPATYFTEERSKYGLYTSGIFKMLDYIYVREDNTDIFSMNDLKGKTLAIPKGFGTIDKIKKNFPEIQIVETKDLRESMFKVISGELDALFDGQVAVEYKIREELIEGLKGIPQSSFQAAELHLFVRDELPILQSILQKGLDTITFEEMRAIRSKWLGEGKKADLSENEQVWLDKNIPIRYVYDVDWAPFEWKNELGEHTGIIYDILSLISHRTGIEFKQVPTEKWSQAVDLMKNDSADMFSGVGENEKRKEYLNFTTNNIFKTPYVFVSRGDDNSDYLDTFRALNNKVAAVVDGYTIHGILKEKEPDVPLMLVKSVEHGFEQLRKGYIDVFIVNASTAKYYINRKGFDDLKIATKTEFDLELKIALQKELPEVVLSIIDKGIKSISEKELSDIYFKWTEAQVEKEVDYSILIYFGLGALSLVLLISYWNSKLKLAVKEKTIELEELIHSFDENVIASRSDLKGNITYASEALCRISGFEKDELLGKPHNMLRHPHMPKELFSELWSTIQDGKSWSGEIKNLKKDGGIYWVYSVVSPIFDNKNKIIGYSSIRQDITSKKEVEELSHVLEDKVIERTKELDDERRYVNSVINSQQNFSITTDGKSLKTANKSFMKFFDIKDVSEFIDKYGSCICDTFDKYENGEYLQKMTNGEKWIDYVYARPETTHKATITRNGKKHIFIVTADEFTFQDEQLKVGVFYDVTELEEAKRAAENMANDLNVKVDELNRFNKIAVGRELKMIELKSEVNELLQEQKYKIVKVDDFDQINISNERNDDV